MYNIRDIDSIPYKDVRDILLFLFTRVQNILGERLTGFYLYGSLSLGDFDPLSSDIDFLVVTDGDVTEAEFEWLRVMHEEIARSELPYADHLEGSYIPRESLRRYDPEDARHPTVGVDWEFHRGLHGQSWTIERHIVREHGVVIYGPDPKTLIDPVPVEAIRAAVCHHLKHFWHDVVLQETPAWLRKRDYQAFAILTMCRAMYTFEHGTLCSKPQAALWAQEAYPSWRPMIERAILWRHQHEEDDMTELLAFVQEALRLAENRCNPSLEKLKYYK